MSVKWNDDKAMKYIRKMIAAKLEVVGEYVEGEAKKLCPVDLGNLRNSITHKVDEQNLSVRIGTNVDYAPYVEFGTGEFAENGQGRKGGWFYTDPKTGKSRFTFGNHPHPFLRPAVFNNKDEIRRILATVIFKPIAPPKIDLSKGFSIKK